MKRLIINFILIIICFILQTTLLPMLHITSIMPNILIILISCTGFMQGNRNGLFVGFVCGLLMDIYSFDIFGFYSVLYMLIGFLNGFVHNFFYLKDLKIPAILITSSDLFSCLIIYLFLFLLRSRLDFGGYFLNIIIPEVAFTLLLSVIVYPVFWLIEAYGFGKKNAESQ